MPDDIIPEIWKPWREGTYSISNQGRVRRELNGHSHNARAGYVLKPYLGKQARNEYHFVHLRTPNCPTGESCRVHRLVAEAFLGPCPHDLQVNHKNGIKHDNRADNLEYVTASENCKHAFRVGLRIMRGVANSRARLSEDDVRHIRLKRSRGVTLQSLAHEYGLSISAIHLAARGTNWKHI